MQKTNRFLFLELLLLLFCLPAAHSQLTLRVNAIPANTPQGANIHAVGTFNNWNPGDPNTVLASLGNGQYSITVTPPAGEVKFKFTRGSWATVEGNANGGFLPDRVLTYSGQPTTVELTILSWEDLGGSNSTAAPNVSILSNNFFMPQLNRNRRIWLYLPPDYHTTSKKYPVLYMHDAQNLFDAATSFAGEWEVDESLNTLHQQGDHGCIVVGIDNGGAERLNEYSPWVNLQYNAGGQGDDYVEFIASTLKPHIDSTFRTLPGRTTTGIMGSSMGGLISMYAFSERQDVFSRAGIFSPAFWFGGSSPAVHVAANPREGEARVYFLAGGQEPASVAQNMQVVADAMTTAGFLSDEKFSLVPADGQHSEWFWRREFPAAYIWLFAGAVSSTGTLPETEGDTIGVYPNPAGSWVRLSSVQPDEKVEVQIANAAGKRLRTTTLQGGEPLWTGDLPIGFYVLKIRKSGGNWQTVKLVRQ